jgi:hypothetical protein
VSGRPHRLVSVPPFLVGAAAAIAAEVAIGLLLYAGPGLVRSLTVVLAVEGTALAAGLWSAPRSGPDIVDRLRRPWLFCLLAFLAATLFGGAWSLVESVGEGRLGQGLGLVILAALPLYFAGMVLGGMSAVATRWPAIRQRSPGAAAALGAGVGFVITGVLLPRAPLPGSLLVACIVMLSLGGMIFGVVLGSMPDIRVRAETSTAVGDVRVEDRRLPSEGRADRVLLEGAHERRRLSLGRDGDAPWDVAAARALIPDATHPWRVLAVGGGASPLARSLVKDHPRTTIDILERTRAVLELASEHFDTGLGAEGRERVHVRVGNLDDLLQDVQGPYDAVFIDAAALGPIGGARALSRASRVKLVAALGPSGVFVWGPTLPEPGVRALVDGWHHAVFERTTPAGHDEFVIVSGRLRFDALPASFEGFLSENGEALST